MDIQNDVSKIGVIMYRADDVILKASIKNLDTTVINKIEVVMKQERTTWYKKFLILPEDIDATTGAWYMTLSSEETALFTPKYKLVFQCCVHFTSGLKVHTNFASKPVKDILLSRTV